MKKIMDRIANTFRSKSNEEQNVYTLCRNASGELSAYCNNENIK